MLSCPSPRGHNFQFGVKFNAKNKFSDLRGLLFDTHIVYFKSSSSPSYRRHNVERIVKLIPNTNSGTSNLWSRYVTFIIYRYVSSQSSTIKIYYFQTKKTQENLN